MGWTWEHSDCEGIRRGAGSPPSHHGGHWRRRPRRLSPCIFGRRISCRKWFQILELPEADQLGKTFGFPLPLFPSRECGAGQNRWSGADGSALLETGEHTMRRRMLAAALACTLLAGCGPVRTEPVEQETPRAGAPVIAYVPLDDRPDNAERVVYLAESLGYELAMPGAGPVPAPGWTASPRMRTGPSTGTGEHCTSGWLSRRPPGVTGTSCPWISCSPAGWSAPGL